MEFTNYSGELTKKLTRPYYELLKSSNLASEYYGLENGPPLPPPFLCPISTPQDLRGLPLNPDCNVTHRLWKGLATLLEGDPKEALPYHNILIWNSIHSPRRANSQEHLVFCGDDSTPICFYLFFTTGLCPPVGWITHQPFLTPLAHLRY